ncbi:MAG: glycoside hydrolase family 5 protein [Treponema sp.]|jgi:endoglucanase|nr:glycoside hydrolase family 5 protein [Treponema sp.]
MKKIFFIFIVSVFLAGCNTSEPATVDYSEGNVDGVLASSPFEKGVNFSGWFESFSASSIPFTKYVEQDFVNVKSLGADVIRLPIRMHSMTGGQPDYTLDPLLLKFLDMAVDWAEKYGLYIIIDNHSFDPVKNTEDDIDKILIPVWEQVAQRYKNRSDYVIYEILNEPHGISDARWGEVQGLAINAIRKHDTKHYIIVGGTDYNSLGKMSALPEYSDTKLIYTFHFYDPYLFTHQGAGWGGPPVLSSLAGVPFPYNSKRMPKIPAELKGTWVEGSLNYSYSKDADPNTLYNTLNKAVSFSKERNVPIFCGEFGVYMINSLKEDRVRWYQIVSKALAKRRISRTSWDYYGGFGIFNSEGRGDFFADLNTDVVRALGFTPPPQKPYQYEPFKTGFTIYDDYPNRDFTCGYWDESTDFSLYDTNAAKGDFSIRWGNASQYNTFYFVFERGGNLSEVANNGILEFQARTEGKAKFDIRFVNPESPSSIPWRMRYTIDDTLLVPDGKWHTIRIPLNSMEDLGAWINSTQEWIPSQNKFSWNNIKQLDFVAEHGDMKGVYVWFDDIKLVVP